MAALTLAASIAALTGLIKAHPFISAYMGYDVLNTLIGVGKDKGDRKISRASLKLQEQIESAKMEASKTMTSESRASAKGYMKQLSTMNESLVDERRDARSEALIAESKNRQFGMMMAAIQAMSQKDMGASTTGGLRDVGMLTALRR